MIRPLCRIGAFALFAAAGTAGAADLPMVPLYAPQPVSTWSGFYGGVNAGFAWSNGNSVDITTTRSLSLVGLNGDIASAVATQGTGQVTLSNNGYAGGGQIGYNQQFEEVVFGIEADIDWLGKSNNQAVVTNTGLVPNAAVPITSTGTLTASRSIDYLGTVRGRVGFLATPTVMPYLTGGLAYAQPSATVTIRETLGFIDTPAPFGTNGSFADTRYGWTVGGGLEWIFARCWSAKAEYLYYDLGSATQTLANIQQFGQNGTLLETISAAQFSTRIAGNIARVGVNYHFGGY
jgi:outer membrane immunogenic protein